MQTTLRAVLFDLDGTLLDTAPDMVGALDTLRRESGLAPLPFDAVRAWGGDGAIAAAGELLGWLERGGNRT